MKSFNQETSEWKTTSFFRSCAEISKNFGSFELQSFFMFYFSDRVNSISYLTFYSAPSAERQPEDL